MACGSRKYLLPDYTLYSQHLSVWEDLTIRKENLSIVNSPENYKIREEVQRPMNIYQPVLFEANMHHLTFKVEVVESSTRLRLQTTESR